LRLSPKSKLTSCGFNLSSVECYGGGLWHTWFDRDLKLGGKIIYKDENNIIKEKIVGIGKAVAKISNLAVHLMSMEERKTFEFNKETHLRPIFSTEEFEKIMDNGEKKENKETEISKNHYKKLIELICKESGIKEENIINWDLRFSDFQPA